MRNRRRRALFLLGPLALTLASGCLLAARSTPAAAPRDTDGTQVTFERYDVVTGSGRRQTVLPGFFLGGAVAELAAVNVDENDDRRLRLYGFGDGTWEPLLETTLGPEVLFVDVANIGGRDRLVTYEPGRLNWFDPESATERPLVAVPSNYEAPPGGEVPQVDVTRDVNDDGRDDLVVPDSDGFWVLVQRSDGAFADPVKLGPPTRKRMTGGADGYQSSFADAPRGRYNPWELGLVRVAERAQGRVHGMDYDQDGRNDLVFWNEDHFEVHHQDESERFAPAAGTFTIDVAFDSTELYSLMLDVSYEERTSFGGEKVQAYGNKVLHSLDDLNGDDVADLVTVSLEGLGEPEGAAGAIRSLFRMHTIYEVHPGALGPDGGTVFAPAPAATFSRPRSIQFGMRQHDFDGDGQVDLMFTTIGLGIFKMVGGLMAGSTSLDLEFYRMEGGVYPDKPSARRKIKADFRGDDAFYPSALIADVNGDGRSDLLVQKGRKELRIFLGVPGPTLFARRPQKLAIAMPDDPGYTRLVNLNDDGVPDILIHNPSSTEPHRVTMLIPR